MEIQLHEKGGLFGAERTVVVDDGSVTVSTGGGTAQQALPPAVRAQLHDAVGRVMAEPHPVHVRDIEVYDASEMTIDLRHRGVHRTLTIRGADEPTETVLHLLDLIDAASESTT